LNDAPRLEGNDSPRIDTAPVAELYRDLAAAVGETVIGQQTAVRLVFVTLLCRGHSLLEGVPGLAKTLLVRSLAACLGVRFGRVQFTPDLMPSDILGTPILDPRSQELRFRAGPLFTDLLLADEINRASAKTQAALLEAMQERSATVDGTLHPLGPHFAVFATQNPVEQEGTYPLPEAELDRFLFKIAVEYPSEADERALLARHHASDGSPAAPAFRVAPEALERAREIVRGVLVRDEIVGYAATLVRATRADLNFTLGGSPRAGVLLLRAAKALAALEGRDFVLPEDVQEAWLPALRHRVVLEPSAEVEGLRVDEALRRTLESVTVPR
jgi:MoxR-like ATPase